MFFFNRSERQPLSIEETVSTYKELAGRLFEKGDIDEVHRLYSETYAELMKGRKGHALEEMKVRQAMEQALQDVMTGGDRERRRYFQTYRDGWWR